MGRIPGKYRFGDKSIKKLVVPEDTTEIGEWAYGACSALEEVHIPKGCRVSDRAFAGSDGIRRIFLYNEKGERVNALPGLLALAVTVWPGDTSRIFEAASDDAAFLEWLDERLPLYLAEEDSLGYIPFLAGGEEDYRDETEERKEHERAVKLRKARFMYERLLAGGIRPPGDEKSRMSGRLKDYGPGISFALMKEDSERKEEYGRLFFELCIDGDAGTGKLLEYAGEDAGLRAMVLRHSGGEGVEGLDI